MKGFAFDWASLKCLRKLPLKNFGVGGAEKSPQFT